MSLSNTQIKNAKPKEKQYKIADRDGLYLLVRPNGTKAWKYDYRLGGKRGTYAIGTYPEVSLAEARNVLRDARLLVQQGHNPTQIKQAQKAKNSTTGTPFSAYCNQWIDKQNYQPTTEKDLRQRLKKHIYPHLDNKSVDQFTTRELYSIVLKMTDVGIRETAFRMIGVLRRVYNELFTLGIVESNPAQGLAELLPKVDQRTKSNFAHLTNENELKLLMQAIHSPAPRQHRAVTLALQLMPLLFLRPKNIRFMKWDQIDFSNALLTIPGSEMKTGKELKVPLATQSLEILREAENIKHETSPYVFTTTHGNGGPMSENTTTYALGRLTNPKTGEKFGRGFMTSHGFRHTASTMLNEMGYNPDVIELQLAHENRDRIRATYNKAQLMEKRRHMMQDWANYIQRLSQLDTYE